MFNIRTGGVVCFSVQTGEKSAAFCIGIGEDSVVAKFCFFEYHPDQALVGDR